MKDTKIVIGIPNGSGLFPAMTVEALLKMKKTVPCMVSIVERQRTDVARNAIVKMALEGGASHVLFVDDDNPPPEDTIEKFLQDDKDIVCSPIPTRNPNEQGAHDLCLFTAEEVKEGNGKGMTIYKNMNKLNTSGSHLVKVDGCGMGCTLIKAEVLAKLFAKYEGKPFEYGDTTFTKDPKKLNVQRRTMSEDMEFIERATEEGFEVWCDTRVRAPHIGRAKVFQFNDSHIE